jgi:hypothetical protein
MFECIFGISYFSDLSCVFSLYLYIYIFAIKKNGNNQVEKSEEKDTLFERYFKLVEHALLFS